MPEPLDKIESAQVAWNKVNEGRSVPVAEGRTIGMLIERGILPVTGGSEEGQTVLSEKAIGVQQDLEAVFNLPPQELTPQARSFLQQTATEIDETNGKVEIKITDDVRKLLIQNGISVELVNKYQNNPEVLIAMLVARSESNRIFQRDANAPPIDFEKEDAVASSM